MAEISPVVFIGALVCGFVAAVIASNKGRNSASWFVIGLLFTVVGIIAAMVAEPASSVRATPASGARRTAASSPRSQSHEPEKKCPYCAEWIKAEAIKCRYCGSEVQQVAPGPPTQEPETKPLTKDNRPLTKDKVTYDSESSMESRRPAGTRLRSIGRATTPSDGIDVFRDRGAGAPSGRLPGGSKVRVVQSVPGWCQVVAPGFDEPVWVDSEGLI